MAENGMSAEAQPQRTGQQGQCTGNCMRCTIFQRQYCASQLAYSNMRMLEQMQGEIISLQENCKALSAKIDAMQNNEATLFNPTTDDTIPSEPIAQSGDGVTQ